MEGLTQFKVFLKLGNDQKPEIRRFAVNKDEIKSVINLRIRFREMFPVLKDNKYFIFWKGN